MFANWEIIFSFRIHGVIFPLPAVGGGGRERERERERNVLNYHQVSNIGADGLAFWYTERIDKAGSLFGNDEFFKGIGVVIDT